MFYVYVLALKFLPLSITFNNISLCGRTSEKGHLSLSHTYITLDEQPIFICIVAKEINLPVIKPLCWRTSHQWHREGSRAKGCWVRNTAVGLKWGENGTVYQSEVKVSILKVFYLLYVQSQIDCKSLRFCYYLDWGISFHSFITHPTTRPSNIHVIM